MRILVTIAHYFKQSAKADWRAGGSVSAPLPKMAALNAQIVGLHRYFGPRRLSLNPDDPQGRSGAAGDVLDIVVMTKPDSNLLERIGLDRKAYSVEHFDGPPLMLPFEAQRIMRDRVGQYDLYAYMEDDLIVDDPAFFAKIAWFAAEFGPRALLLPIRYEMASTGTPAKVSLSPRLSNETRAPFRRREFSQVLKGRWNGAEQTFRLPVNPHAGCYVLNDQQLRLWIDEPSFYDRDVSWIDPLVSAATHAPGKVFGLYMAAEPDPWFLQIEHYGNRFAVRAAEGSDVFGGPLLLALMAAMEDNAGGDSSGDAPRVGALDLSLRGQAIEASRLRSELDALKGSRSRLFKAWLSATLRKTPGGKAQP